MLGGAYSDQYRVHNCQQVEQLKRQSEAAIADADTISRVRRLSYETNKRRRALEIKRKTETQREERRRSNILLKRHDEQQQATEKYQRSPVRIYTRSPTGDSSINGSSGCMSPRPGSPMRPGSPIQPGSPTRPQSPMRPRSPKRPQSPSRSRSGQATQDITGLENALRTIRGGKHHRQIIRQYSGPNKQNSTNQAYYTKYGSTHQGSARCSGRRKGVGTERKPVPPDKKHVSSSSRTIWPNYTSDSHSHAYSDMKNHSTQCQSSSRALFEQQLQHHQQQLAAQQEMSLRDFNTAILKEIEEDHRVLADDDFDEVDEYLYRDDSICSSPDSLEDSPVPVRAPDQNTSTGSTNYCRNDTYRADSARSDAVSDNLSIIDLRTEPSNPTMKQHNQTHSSFRPLKTSVVSQEPGSGGSYSSIKDQNSHSESMTPISGEKALFIRTWAPPPSPSDVTNKVQSNACNQIPSVAVSNVKNGSGKLTATAATSTVMRATRVVNNRKEATIESGLFTLNPSLSMSDSNIPSKVQQSIQNNFVNEHSTAMCYNNRKTNVPVSINSVRPKTVMSACATPPAHVQHPCANTPESHNETSSALKQVKGILKKASESLGTPTQNLGILKRSSSCGDSPSGFDIRDSIEVLKQHQQQQEQHKQRKQKTRKKNVRFIDLDYADESDSDDSDSILDYETDQIAGAQRSTATDVISHKPPRPASAKIPGQRKVPLQRLQTLAAQKSATNAMASGQSAPNEQQTRPIFSSLGMVNRPQAKAHIITRQSSFRVPVSPSKGQNPSSVKAGSNNGTGVIANNVRTYQCIHGTGNSTGNVLGSNNNTAGDMIGRDGFEQAMLRSYQNMDKQLYSDIISVNQAATAPNRGHIPASSQASNMYYHPVNGDDQQYWANNDGNSIIRIHVPTENNARLTAEGDIRLDRTPTDDEINVLWDNVRNCLTGNSASIPEQLVHNIDNTSMQSNLMIPSDANDLSRKQAHVSQKCFDGVALGAQGNISRIGPMPNQVVKDGITGQVISVNSQPVSNNPSSHYAGENTMAPTFQSYGNRRPLLQNRQQKQPSSIGITSRHQVTAAGYHKGPTLSPHEPQNGRYPQQPHTITESLAAFMTAEELVQRSVSESQIHSAMELTQQRHQALNQPHDRINHTKGPTLLSMEEQRLLESLDRLNEQLKITEKKLDKNGMAMPQQPTQTVGFRGHRPLMSASRRCSGVNIPTPPGAPHRVNSTASVRVQPQQAYKYF